MNRKKKNTSSVESLDDFNIIEDGFTDGDIDLGNTVMSFNFNMATESKKSDVQQPHILFSKEPLNTKSTQNNGWNSLKGLTPPIDGEYYTVKRCYQFRPSTLRKLNELKAKNPDFNIYLNTIIDTAILHYYNYIISSSKDINND